MSRFVLGINDSHNSAACLLEDGKIVAAANEERFTRIKAQGGYPAKAIEFCLRFAGVRPSELVQVAFGWINMTMNPHIISRYEMNNFRLMERVANRVRIWTFFRPLTERFYDAVYFSLGRRYRLVRLNTVLRHLKIESDKVVFVDHHLCHALSALYCSNLPSQGIDAAVLTNDGRGENVCATVSAYKNGILTPVAKTHYTNSLGGLYSSVTQHLGMTSAIDEYKIMGLAGYVRSGHAREEYKTFRSLISVSGRLEFHSKVSAYSYRGFLASQLRGHRFDNVAAALQSATEDLLVTWAAKAMERLRVSALAAGGGTFQNVKANMRIAELPEARQLFVMPSPGDETTAVGAAIAARLALDPSAKIEPIRDLYWGPGVDNAQAKSLLESLPGADFSWARETKPSEAVGELITKGEIVGVCRGRMEFGSRALGNRSILADASKRVVTQTINMMIKKRDWWMPFAPVIARGNERDYILSPDCSKIDDQYMIFAGRSTPRARKDLPAALHPYDDSLRPQVIDSEWNEMYFDTIRQCAAVNGRSGLLNTSFNLHEEPIVCTAEDALASFQRSGLTRLLLGDFIVEKNRQAAENEPASRQP